MIHPELPRKCIKQEYQAVMSFPQSFIFAGNEDDARARIGNSVPPNLMKAIAEHIKVNILQRMTDAFPNIEIKRLP